MHTLFIISIIYTLIELLKENFIYKKHQKTHMENNYPKPHRNKQGKIIIENVSQWKKDREIYENDEVWKFVQQGKYNLTQKELEKERKNGYK